VALLKRKLTSFPSREDFVFMLAQLYMRKEDFAAARQLIDTLSNSNDPELRHRADGLRSQLVWLEKELPRIRATTGADSDSGSSSDTQNSRDVNGAVVIVHEVDPDAVLRESLRKPATGEIQTQATLMRIDCDAKGITFVVKIADRFHKLSTDSFSHMELITFTADAGRQVTCGLRKPEDNVVVAYVPTSDARSKVDGVVKSVEFVPQNFKLKP